MTDRLRTQWWRIANLCGNICKITKASPAGEFSFVTTEWIWSSFHPGRLRAIRRAIGVVCALRPEKDLGTLIAAFTG